MNTETLLVGLAAILGLSNAIIIACFWGLWRKRAREAMIGHSLETLAHEFTRIAESWNKTAEAWKQLGEAGVKLPENYQALGALLQTQVHSVEQLERIGRTLDRIQSSEMEGAERQAHHFSELLKRFEAAMAESRYREADMLRDALSSFLSQQSNIQREGESHLHSQVQELRQSVNLLVEKQGTAAEDMGAQLEQERISREQGNLNRLQVVLGNQAELLQASGDLVGAMSRLKEQEAICRQLGNADGLLRALNNQAVILHAMGNLREAMSLNQEVESIIRHTLQQSEGKFSSEHPDTLERLSHLAESLERKGDYAEAEMLYWRVMVASERMFGPEHATTQVSRENVARVRAHSSKSGPETVPSRKPPDKIIGAMHESRTDEVPMPRIDKVHFSVASPPTVPPGQKFIVDVWAHLERQRAEVERRVQQAHPKSESPPVIRPKGPFKIERGTKLFVRLKFPDLHVDPPEDVILWEGEIGNASFEVAIPSETPEGAICGLVSVHWEGGLQIARVSLRILVAAKAAPAAPTTQPLHHIRKAFASYASPDRDEVLGRVQGMQKIAPDLDVFLDVVKLRSGEDWEKKLWQVIPESDVFYLFWSAAAKASPWVEKEWRCALNSRGDEFIDPVPLVSPEEVRPPDELSKKHFNDWILAFRRGGPKASE